MSHRSTICYLVAAICFAMALVFFVKGIFLDPEDRTKNAAMGWTLLAFGWSSVFVASL